MPRYFFSCEGAQTFDDVEGVELADQQAAQFQAIRNASEVLKDHAEAFAGDSHWRAVVVDEDGRTVFSISLDTEVKGTPPR